MLLKTKGVVTIIPLFLLLAACGGGKEDKVVKSASSLPPAPAIPDDEANAKIGNPYEIKGESFTPADNTQYDEVGYGSWYGSETAGRQTSNGETFNPDAISAAHKTLPMPSYVEVTNLDTGKTILVRINDRGPFAENRIIDLSKAAAQQLGVEGQGTFPVRVRRVNPPEQEKDVLRRGERAGERIDTPESLLVVLRKHLPAKAAVVAPPADAPKPKTPAAKPKPAPKPTPMAKPQAKPVVTPPDGGDRFVEEGAGTKPVAKPEKPSSSGTYYVQIGAFSAAERAKALATKTGGTVLKAGAISRVVVGPYGSEADARSALKSMVAKGYRDARITR